MGDLIDSINHAWKPNLVRALYPSPISFEILSSPISKTGANSDRLVWRHSSSRDYQLLALPVMKKKNPLPISFCSSLLPELLSMVPLWLCIHQIL